MFKRLATIVALAFAFASFSATGASAAVKLQPLPAGVGIEGLAGNVTLGSIPLIGTGGYGYGNYNLKTGAETFFEPAVWTSNSTDWDFQTGSAYGFITRSVPPGGAQAQFTLLKHDGTSQVLEKIETSAPPCPSEDTALALSGAGAATIFHPALVPTGAANPCRIDTAGSSLFRLSSTGKKESLWFPEKFMRLPSEQQTVMSGDVLALQSANYFIKTRVTFLDTVKKRVLRVFQPQGGRGHTDVQMSDTGVTLVSRNLHVKKHHPSDQRFQILKTPTSRAVTLHQGRYFTVARACGDHTLAASNTSDRDGSLLRRLRVFSASGEVEYDKTFGKYANVSLGACSSKLATIIVDQGDPYFSDTPGASYWFPLGGLGK
jgi:hypothetical protein